MAKLWVNRASKHKVPPAIDTTYKVGEKFLVFREKIFNHQIGKRLGCFIVIEVEMNRKLVYIQLKDNEPSKALGLAKVIKYSALEHTFETFFIDIRKALELFKNDDFSCVSNNLLFFAKVFSIKDQQVVSKEIITARKVEINGLIEQRTLQVISKNTISGDAIVLPERFVLGTKSADGKIFHKARFEVDGHRDSMKHYIVQESQSIQTPTMCPILALAATNSIDAWAVDVPQAYLQSDQSLGQCILKQLFLNLDLHQKKHCDW